MNYIAFVVIGLIAAILALMLYVRLAPLKADEVHAAPLPHGPAGAATGAGSHTVILDVTEPAATLAAIDRVARATPRTQVLAGDMAEGRITYVTRSALWGFPDFTTVEARPEAGQVVLFGRLRFGKSDLGVNRARIEGWLAQLDQDTPAQ